MAHIVMAFIVMADVVLPYIVMALYSYGPTYLWPTYGIQLPCRYGLYSYVRHRTPGFEASPEKKRKKGARTVCLSPMNAAATAERGAAMSAMADHSQLRGGNARRCGRALRRNIIVIAVC